MLRSLDDQTIAGSEIVVPSLRLAVAKVGALYPAGILNTAPLVRLSVATAFGSTTEIVADPLMPFAVAVTEAWPNATPVATPVAASTVRMDGSADAQLNVGCANIG